MYRLFTIFSFSHIPLINIKETAIDLIQSKTKTLTAKNKANLFVLFS
jgi:hypothetical protein